MNDQQRCVAGCPHRDLAVGWALHALEPAEESLVAVHMPDCPTCIGTAAETEKMGATLGLSLLEESPVSSWSGGYSVSQVPVGLRQSRRWRPRRSQRGASLTHRGTAPGSSLRPRQ